jgi:hypothetical protein
MNEPSLTKKNAFSPSVSVPPRKKEGRAESKGTHLAENSYNAAGRVSFEEARMRKTVLAVALAAAAIAAALALAWLPSAPQPPPRPAAPTAPPLAPAALAPPLAPAALAPPLAPAALAPPAPEAAPAPLAPPAAVPAPAGAITGVVLEAAGLAPLASARAACRPAGAGDVRGTRVDAAGRFGFDVPPGAYEVIAVAPGYLAPDPQPVDVGPGAGPAPLRFALARGGVLEGTVLASPGGRPIAGARVALAAPLPPRYVPPYAPIETDERGRFALGGVPRGAPLRLEARAPGFLPRAVDLAPLEPTEVRREGIEVALARAGRIRGRVFAPGGGPSGGARVWIFALGGGPAKPPARLAAGKDGAFASEPLPDGTYLVAAEGDDLAETPAPASVTLAGGEDAPPLDLALAPPLPIDGRVTDAAGAALPGAEVSAERRGDLALALPPRRAAATAGPDGAFSLPAGAGLFAVRAVRAGYLPAEAPGIAGGARDVALALAAAPHAPVVGRLRGAGGKPIADVPVVFERAETRGLPLSFRTDGFGELAVEGVAPGHYTISFLESGSSPDTGIRVRLREVDVSSDEPLDLRVEEDAPRGAITGLARLPPPPESGPYQVDLRPEERPTDRFGFLSAARVAEDGSFRFTDVPPGGYVVRVTLVAPEGARRIEAPVVVRPGEEALVELDGK